MNSHEQVIAMKFRMFPGCAELLTVAAMTLLAGCGGSDNVEVYPVKGTVLFDGKPMAGGGSISFVPVSSQKGKGAGGVINTDGTYVMSTYADGDGSMAGTFRVVINQTVQQEPDFGGDSDAPGAAKNVEPVQVVGQQDQIPLIYSDPVQSPITVTVEAKDQNEIPVNLERMQSPGQMTGA